VLGVAGAWLGGVSSAHDPARGVGPSHLDLLATSLRLLRLGTLSIRGLEVSPFFGLLSNCRRSGPFTITGRYSGGGRRRRKTCRDPPASLPLRSRLPRIVGLVPGLFTGGRAASAGFERSLGGSSASNCDGIWRYGLETFSPLYPNLSCAPERSQCGAVGWRGVRRGSGAAFRIAEIRSEVESYPAEIIYNMHETGPLCGASLTELNSRPDNDGRRGAPTQGRP